MREWKPLPSATKKSLLSTAFLTFSCLLGIDIHTPSLPSMVTFFQTNNDMLQYAITLFVFGAGLGIFVWGPEADRYGRKPIITLGASIVILSAIAATTTTSIHIFLFLRLLQGIGSGALMCLCRVIAADLLNRKQLANIGASVGLITGMAPMLAPIIGGYIEEHIGWHGSFIAYAFFCSIGLWVFLINYEESLKEKVVNTHIIQNYMQIFRKKNFLFLALLQGVILSVLNCYAVVAPFLVQNEIGLSPVWFGWLCGLCSVSQLTSKICSPSFIRRFGAYRVHRIGWVLLLSSALLLMSRTQVPGHNIALFIGSIALAFFSIHMIIPFLFTEAMSLSASGKGILGAGFSSTAMLISALVSKSISAIPYEGSGLLASCYFVLAMIGLLMSRSLKPAEE
ncbi:MFS transporter [Candidatus Synchoanobacter obligatus]|uniref:MFS transporter n=1 Tax=Candidatus Synchoanobacter obligatus TaxID=2919597 RepID=A0ABT1L4N4_9GAMM|nr:MFS transporter [Candidatus Synchoanobacter obligatus]